MKSHQSIESASSEFETQLELFRTEAQSAIQFYYAWESINAEAYKDRSIRTLLNEAPLLWNTILGALQGSTFVAIGRLFDPNPQNYSATRLLGLGLANLEIFSKEQLEARKRRHGPDRWDGRDEYMKSVYVPTKQDFRRLKAYLNKKRRIYESKIRPLRHEVFAHRAVLSPVEVSDLFGKITLGEMRRLLVFLHRLYEALWQLYFNGRKPTLRPAKHSTKRILEQGRSQFQRSGPVHIRLVRETSEFLNKHKTKTNC